MNIRRGWLAIPWLLLVACPNQPSGPPEPDECSDPPAVVDIDSLETGAGNPDSLFAPWADGEQVTLVFGPQGGAMIPMRLRVTGANAPDCLPQQTRVTVPALDGGLIAEDFTTVGAYQQDGARVTRTLFVILDQSWDGTVNVETTAGGLTATHTLELVQ